MALKARLGKYGLRSFALGYLGMLLLIPLVMIVIRAFDDGASVAWESISNPDAIHAFKLTLLMVAIAVPLNTLFGIACALILVRTNFRGKAFLNALIDIPFAISPVVIGLCLVLVYGVDGWLGQWFVDNGVQIIFSVPGMVIATIFVSLPFVVREVVPVLQEIGDDQEQAARTLGAGGWQTFRRITLPSIRWGVTYGVVLATARALGEFGAVAVVSGRITGETQTLPLYVQQEFNNFNVAGAYTAALVLALLALFALVGMNLIRRRDSSLLAPTTAATGTEAAQ
jgi:sulfate/thiosulfate transport system permease protein